MSKKLKIIWIAIFLTVLLIGTGLLIFQLFFTTTKRVARYKQQGSEYLYEENYEKAAREYSMVVALAPNDLVSHYKLAEAFYSLEDYNSAIHYLTQAIERAEAVELPETDTEAYVSLYIKLADCYDLIGNDKQKVEMLKKGYARSYSIRIDEILKKYYPGEAQADLQEGEYMVEEALEVSLIGEGSIYYTLDGTVPTKDSKLFQEPIIVTFGINEIKALVNNEYDFSSSVISLTYHVKEVNYLERGNQSFDNQEFELAYADYQKAIIKNKQETKAYLGMARIDIIKNNPETAIEKLQLGLSYDENQELRQLLEELMPTIKASLPSGSYTTQEDIVLTLTGEGAEIYYTTDSSIPNSNSTRYTGPILLREGNNVINAVSESTYNTLGEVKTYLYTIVYDKTNQVDNEDTTASDTKQDSGEDNGNMNKGDASNNTGIDEDGNIIWRDKQVEKIVRKVLNQKTGAISKKTVEAYKGSLDLSEADVVSLKDLVWFKNLTVLSCKGNAITNSELINNLKAERIIAVYHNLEEVKAIENVKTLKEIKRLGIRVSNFSLGNMSMLEMLEFFSKMNQLMKALTNLEYLDLSNNGLSDISMLTSINNMVNIKYLILRDNDITDISVLRKFTKLVYVDLTNNNVTDYSPVDHVATVVGKN